KEGKQEFQNAAGHHYSGKGFVFSGAAAGRDDERLLFEYERCDENNDDAPTNIIRRPEPHVEERLARGENGGSAAEHDAKAEPQVTHYDSLHFGNLAGLPQMANKDRRR